RCPSTSPSPHPHLFSATLFFFPHPAPTHLYTLSLHDALPISDPDYHPDVPGTHSEMVIPLSKTSNPRARSASSGKRTCSARALRDRKSTRLNSSHLVISYAVFCLKKKKTKYTRKNACSRSV